MDKKEALKQIKEKSSLRVASFLISYNKLMADKEVVLAAVEQGGGFLQYADEKLKADEEIVLTALKNGGTLHDADDKLKADKKFVLKAVKQSDIALRDADEKFKADKEIVLTAVKQFGDALQYADDKLKADKEVVLGALKQSCDSLQHVDMKLKTDKDVPLDILKGSVDDALTNTFALMPKNGPARNIIKAIEGLPGVPVFGTGEFPFARFMANAIAFQFKYSPFNAAVALTNGIGFLRRKNKGLIKAKDLDLENDRALQDFAKRFSESVVGGAALATAYYYRLQNQDTKWYEGRSKDGKTIDLRPFFPLAPYLIIGDLAVKWSKGETIKLTMIGDITEGLTGSQFRAGAASYSLNKFYELFGNPDSISAKEQVGEMFGTYMGEIMGGFFTPGRVLKDIVATFDEESAIVRDPRQIEGEGFERGFDAFLKTTFHKNLPFLEKSLPELQLPTREGTIYRQSPFYGQTLGLRFIQKRTPEERELVRLGFENYEIMRTTGDKKADDLIKKQLAPLIVTFLKPVLNSASYKNFSEPQKRNYVNKYLQDLRADAKSIAKAIAQAESIKDDKPFTPFDRVEYLRLSKDAKALAEEYFQDEYGKSVAETQYYKLGKEIGLMLQKAYSP